jgi:hypothetical protein
MADTNQRPRGGMTLEAISFRQGVFPPWAEKFRDVSPTGWVSQIWRERQAALKIAQVRHEQNEMVRIAKVTGKQPVLAEPAVRQSGGEPMHGAHWHARRCTGCQATRRAREARRRYRKLKSRKFSRFASQAQERVMGDELVRP